MILAAAGIAIDGNSFTEPRANEVPAPMELPSVASRLPPGLQVSVAQIATAGRGPYGHRPTQEIFDRHLATFEEVYRLGAQHIDVCQLLYEIGIRRNDGVRLDTGTVSSALSRARTKAAAGRRNSRTGAIKSKLSRLARAATTEDADRAQIPRSPPEEAEYETLPPPSSTSEKLPTAIQGGSPYIPATGADDGNPPNVEHAASLPPTAWSPSPTARGSPTSGNLANVRNAGALLNKIRSNHD